MSFWQRIQNLFVGDDALHDAQAARAKRQRGSRPPIDTIVPQARWFGADSECVDDGPDDARELLEHLGSVVRDDLRIEGPHASVAREEDGSEYEAFEGGRRWTIGFQGDGKAWRATVPERDFGPILALVNEALHAQGAPRRVHVVSSSLGQDFVVACASTDEVQRLLSAGWDVEPGLPNTKHVLAAGGLRFFGDRHFDVSQGDVYEAVLAEAATIAGIACAAARVSFVNEAEDDGSKPALASATLAEDLPLACGTLRAGTEVSFVDASKRILAEAILHEAHDLAGTRHAKGTTVIFREDGSIADVERPTEALDGRPAETG